MIEDGVECGSVDDEQGYLCRECFEAVEAGLKVYQRRQSFRLIKGGVS